MAKVLSAGTKVVILTTAGLVLKGELATATPVLASHAGVKPTEVVEVRTESWFGETGLPSLVAPESVELMRYLVEVEPKTALMRGPKET